jgi:putative addiction module CopG family antidote
MTITLDPKTEAVVREKVDSGHYRDTAEVIQEAIRLLDERDRLAVLRSKLENAEAQADRGEVFALTDELWDEIDREAEEAFRAGKHPNPDVCP